MHIKQTANCSYRKADAPPTSVIDVSLKRPCKVNDNLAADVNFRRLLRLLGGSLPLVVGFLGVQMHWSFVPGGDGDEGLGSAAAIGSLRRNKGIGREHPQESSDMGDLVRQFDGPALLDSVLGAGV
jgi:hypothetical protein